MVACELPFFSPRLAAYGTVLVGGWPVAVAWYGRPVGHEVRFQLHAEGRGGDLWHVIRHGHALIEGDGDGRLVGCQQSTET